ncbi:MAG: hypothetical protein DRP22_02680 [Verrucomicrobia bacterium]|nr:MAG: hypothetical protein DRP22_02680 [Verrucomicrobiota bacterium]
MKYYYLAASLPALVLGEAPPITQDKFLFSCSTVLDPADLQELERINQGRTEECTSAFMTRWREAETQLRNAVAAIRAQRRGVEVRPYLREHTGFQVWIEKGVTDAFAKENPREREMALDRLRWQILDELSRADPFGVGPVFAFALKLQSAWKWAGLDTERGRRLLSRAYTTPAEAAVSRIKGAAEEETALAEEHGAGAADG